MRRIAGEEHAPLAKNDGQAVNFVEIAMDNVVKPTRREGLRQFV